MKAFKKVTIALVPLVWTGSIIILVQQLVDWFYYSTGRVAGLVLSSCWYVTGDYSASRLVLASDSDINFS